MKNDALIVGIGGLPRSGKDTLAEIFMAHGYFGISSGDIVRSFAYKRHQDAADPVSVANMTETSNWLRQERGPDVLLQAGLEEFQAKQTAGEQYKGLVLWSIRMRVEADFILERHGELIWIEADDETRYRRNLDHLRKGEVPISLEEFKRQEALQWKPQPGIPSEIQMDVSYVKTHATQMLSNKQQDLQSFTREATQLVELLGR